MKARTLRARYSHPPRCSRSSLVRSWNWPLRPPGARLRRKCCTVEWWSSPSWSAGSLLGMFLRLGRVPLASETPVDVAFPPPSCCGRGVSTKTMCPPGPPLGSGTALAGSDGGLGGSTGPRSGTDDARRRFGICSSTCDLSKSGSEVDGSSLTARVPVPCSALSGAGTVLALRNEMAFRNLGRLSDVALPLRLRLRIRSARTTLSKRLSKKCLRARTVHIDTQMVLPSMMSKKSIACCHVVSVLRLTVLSPASVMAETTMKRLSV